MAESEVTTDVQQSELPDEKPEISIENVHKPTPIASGLYPKYVKTLQEADEVMNRFETNTKSRFCVWRSPKDFGHSGMCSSEDSFVMNYFLFESSLFLSLISI